MMQCPDQSVSNSLRSTLERLLKDFKDRTKQFEGLESSIVLKHNDNYSVVQINCSNKSKEWFFNTVFRFSTDSDFQKLLCVQRGLFVTFQLLNDEGGV